MSTEKMNYREIETQRQIFELVSPFMHSETGTRIRIPGRYECGVKMGTRDSTKKEFEIEIGELVSRGNYNPYFGVLINTDKQRACCVEINFDGKDYEGNRIVLDDSIDESDMDGRLLDFLKGRKLPEEKMAEPPKPEPDHDKKPKVDYLNSAAYV